MYATGHHTFISLVNLPAGKTEIITHFWNSNEPDGGAYFTDVEFLEAKGAP